MINSSKIDIHTHYLPKSYRKVLSENGEINPDGFPIPEWNSEAHLETMESLNISVSMLSISSPYINFGDNDAAIILARKVNEEGAELVNRYPKRFGLLASLPLPAIDGSLAEIEYAMDVLHADGFALPTNTKGVYLGNDCLDAVFAELNRRKAVVVIHPTKPGSVPVKVADNLPLPTMEFLFDTTRTITNMILNGTIKRFPDIRFVVSHAGAFLPLLADRLNVTMQMMSAKTGGDYSDVFSDLRSLYYDVAGFCVPKQLCVLLQVADIDHLFYGSDYPYAPGPVCAFLASALETTNLLTDENRRAIYHDNAVKLFPRLMNA